MRFKLGFVFLVLVSCSGKPNSDSPDSPMVVDVEAALGKTGNIYASSFIERFEYIPLEYSDKTLIQALKKPLIINDTTILLIGFRRITLFDRSTGSYIKDIGHYGNDPGGYRNTISDLVYNAENSSVYANGWKSEYLEYSIESGQIIGKIKKPTNLSNLDLDAEIYIREMAKISPDTFVGFKSNSSGDYPYRLMVFNKSGEISKLFKNHQSFIYKGRVTRYAKDGQFHHYNNQLFFKELFNDTLYMVNQDTLVARYLFELGDKSPPYARRAMLDYETERPKFAFLTDFIETDEALIFTTSYGNINRISLYDKKQNETIISSSDNGYELSKGMINDLDNFIPFHPTELQGNYMLGLTTAEEVSIWFENNADKVASLPASLQKLKDIDPEGNPIVMIGRMK